MSGGQVRSIRPNFVASLTKGVIRCKSLNCYLNYLVACTNFQRIFYQALMLLHIHMLTVGENFISLCYQLEHFVSFFNIVLVLVGVPSQSQLTIPKPYIYNHVKLRASMEIRHFYHALKIVGEDSDSGKHVYRYINIGQPHVINWLITRYYIK